MKTIPRAYTTKTECSIQEAVYLVMSERWLRGLFPRVIFLHSNLPENCYKIFKKKANIE